MGVNTPLPLPTMYRDFKHFTSTHYKTNSPIPDFPPSSSKNPPPPPTLQLFLKNLIPPL